MASKTAPANPNLMHSLLGESHTEGVIGTIKDLSSPPKPSHNPMQTKLPWPRSP